MISIDGSLPLEFAAVCHTSLSLIHLTNGGRWWWARRQRDKKNQNKPHRQHCGPACVLAIASSLSFLFFYHHLPAATTADWADAGLHIQSVLSSRGIYLYSSRDKFIISFIPVKICSFLFHRDLSDHPSSELYQSRQNRPSCEKMGEQNKPDRFSLLKKRNGIFFF
jgi:hypothetical protein